MIQAEDGRKGGNRDCNGKNAQHTVIEVPIGTQFKSADGRITADLDRDGAMFVAARGGAGGKGNSYFASSVNQAPEVAEFGAEGEKMTYIIEMKTLAHVGLVRFFYTLLFTFLVGFYRAECWGTYYTGFSYREE